MTLELSQLKFSYGKQSILKNINLSFPDGGLVCLIGPNGSGKSTLLKCINQILKPTGEVSFNSKNVKQMSTPEIAKTFGYVPQDISSAFPITVFDMILLGRRAYISWNPTKHDLEVVSQNISLLELDDFALRKVNELSGGERQKVLIAMALAQEPKVLLLDEPTSNLDVKHQLDVMKYLKTIVKENKILALMALHDLNLASQYADEVIMLRQGRVYAQGLPKDILTKENIKEVYRVDVAIHSHGPVQHIVPIDDSLWISKKQNLED
jgi:iron complex transport system ATP-binding protein